MILQAEPKTDVTLPHVVRIARGSEARRYLQPTMSTRHRTETVEIIDGARLEVRGEGTSPSEPVPAFCWDELCSFSYNLDSNDLNYQRIADPAPLLVKQGDAPVLELEDGSVGEVVQKAGPGVVVDAEALLLDQEVGGGEAHLEAAGERDRAERAVRGQGHVVGLCHRRCPPHLRDASGM